MPATCRLKLWVPCLSPPANIETPRPNRRLPTIEPASDDLTTPTSPWRRAKKPMMISGALPSEALSKPPQVGPT